MDEQKKGPTNLAGPYSVNCSIGFSLLHAAVQIPVLLPLHLLDDA